MSQPFESIQSDDSWVHILNLEYSFDPKATAHALGVIAEIHEETVDKTD